MNAVVFDQLSAQLLVRARKLERELIAAHPGIVDVVRELEVFLADERAELEAGAWNAPAPLDHLNRELRSIVHALNAFRRENPSCRASVKRVTRIAERMLARLPLGGDVSSAP